MKFKAQRPKFKAQSPQPEKSPVASQLFAILCSFFLAITLLKFGNPVIFENISTVPGDVLEAIFQPWPFSWGHISISILVLLGLKVGRLQFQRNWASAFGLLLPLVWLTWQFVSATQTVDLNLTRYTLKHFTACVVCFYLGWFCLGQLKNVRPVFLGVVISFSFVLIIGWQQHFGGLEETRRFFYAQPNWRDFPADFLKKIASTRIYSTLFYPNTLSAAVLLFFPISAATLWSLGSQFTFAARCLLVGLLGVGAVGCLVWSGSKSGWLLALLLGFISLLQLPFNPATKKWLICGLLILGLGGFSLKYAKFFERGATSVVARFDYWRAALTICRNNPIVGTGPGTFYIPYQKIKAPDSEMARLCHNDYLQQAADSGVVGFLSFTAFILGSVGFFCRPRASAPDAFRFSIWLGLLGVTLHGFVEFNLYIPAIAWPSFLFLGWLWSQRNRIDNKPSAS